MSEPVMVRVFSTNVRAVGYDAGGRRLLVEYASGAVYAYADVPPGLWEGLRRCVETGQSVGAFIVRAVKGKFEFQKLGVGDAT